MEINVKFQGASLDTFVAKLAALGANADTEMARGLDDGGDKVRTLVRRALKDQMGLDTYAMVLDATGSIPAQRKESGLTYKITARGKGLPIRFFGVKVEPWGPVTAMPWGVEHTFKRSFKTSRSGRLLARRNKGRMPVRGLFGPSPAKELIKDQSLATFEAAVPAIVAPTIMGRLYRVMP